MSAVRGTHLVGSGSLYEPSEVGDMDVFLGLGACGGLGCALEIQLPIPVAAVPP